MTVWGEELIAQTWMYSVLSVDGTIAGYATGGIWGEVAPEGTTGPYIIMDHLAGLDLMVVNQERVWTKMTYNVDLVAVGKDYQTPDPAYVQIGALLHRQGGITTGGIVLACTRVGVDIGNSLAAGVEYRHLIQKFELLVQQNAS